MHLLTTLLILITTGPSVLSGQSALSSPHDRERTSRLPPYLPAVENGVGPAEHVSPYVVAGFPSPHAGQRSLKDSGGAHQNDRVIPSPVIVSSRYVCFSQANKLCHSSHIFFK